MVEVLAPPEWGAQVDYDSWDDPFTPDEGVVLHHGGSGDYPAAQAPYTRDKEMAQLQSWEAFHLSRGWRGLAYGWGVGQSGTLYRIRGWNRYGAHLGDLDGDGIANNDELIPIIWIASGNHHTMTDAAHEAIEHLRRDVIEPRSPLAKRLYGHKEVQLDKPTSCPGTGGMDYVTSHRLLEEETTVKPPIWAVEATQWHIDNGIYTQSTVDDVDESVEFHRQSVFRFRARNVYGSGGAAHDHDGRYLKDIAVEKVK